MNNIAGCYLFSNKGLNSGINRWTIRIDSMNMYNIICMGICLKEKLP